MLAAANQRWAFFLDNPVFHLESCAREEIVDYKPFGQAKRKKELLRQEHKKQKAERRAQRQRDKEGSRSSPDPDEDPDIAGIVPGPQQVPADET